MKNLKFKQCRFENNCKKTGNTYKKKQKNY